MSFRVARVSGVPVRVHITSVVAFGALSYAIGFGFISQADSSLASAYALLGGAVTSVLLFSCLLLHEYGHVWCARRFGIEARSVDLFILGGEAKLTCAASDWRQELAIALSGPAISAVLAGLFAAVLLVVEPGSVVSIVAFYLALANALIAAANLAPAYPLDGGRVLHSVLWGLLRERGKSARISALLGEGMGLAAAGYGAFVVLASGLDGLWLILLGWYVFDAAARARADEEAYARLRQSGVAPNCSAG